MTTKLKQSMVAKTAAFILLIVTAALTLVSALGAIVMVDTSFLAQPEQVMNSAFQRIGYEDAYSVFHLYPNEKQNRTSQNTPASYLQNSNATYKIVKEDGTVVSGNYAGQDTPYFFRNYFQAGDLWGYGSEFEYENGVYQGPATEDPSLTYEVTIYLNPDFPVNDKYKQTFELASFGINALKDIGYGVFAIFAFSALACLGCFLFLLCSAGHRKGTDEIVAGPLVRKVPFDLLSAVVFTVGFSLVFFSFASAYAPAYFLMFLCMALCLLATLILAVWYCMNLAVRVKLGRWWQNTLLFRFGRSFLRYCKKLLKRGAWLIQSLPLIWKTVIFCGLFALGSLFTVMLWSDGARATIWLFAMLLLLPAFLYISLMLRSLQSGSRALASGDLSYQVDTTKMVWDFKDAGENLNQISSGMALAVEERLKSERFKTELITNVSHDIKTPLTSIINYADLIAKEENASDTLKEYSAVLLRQADRLKRLLEDLVEASKASTGNLDVLLAPCELGVLLTQTAGEYEQKLQEKDLHLILKGEDTPIKIMADGRRLWRVFDNLMTNVLKYAQRGTRVYLTLEQQGSSVLISFKNTSSYALDIPAEELLERFSRGDASRHTDGNGLGLSIAQSLTELQGGTLSLTVDGDLFKVTLRFPTIS